MSGQPSTSGSGALIPLHQALDQNPLAQLGRQLEQARDHLAQQVGQHFNRHLQPFQQHVMRGVHSWWKNSPLAGMQRREVSNKLQGPWAPMFAVGGPIIMGRCWKRAGGFGPADVGRVPCAPCKHHARPAPTLRLLHVPAMSRASAWGANGQLGEARSRRKPRRPPRPA